MPIGFIGGNFAVLLVCMLLIANGLCIVHRRQPGGIQIVFEHPGPINFPFALAGGSAYAFVRLFSCCSPDLWTAALHIIRRSGLLGSSRSVAGIAPLASGHRGGGGGWTIFSGAMLLNDVYRPDLKADWKRCRCLRQSAADPGAVVAVISANPSSNTELETARYYFGPGRVVDSLVLTRQVT